MTNELKVFNEQKVLGKEFRIYGDIDNPLFLAKDVANWIEHTDLSRMVKLVDKGEKLKRTLYVSGQNREMWFLTEDGLYEVLMQSRKPIAKQFKKEVKNILKSIRKTGGYVSNSELMVNTYFGGVNEESKVLIKGLLDNIEIQQKQLSEQKPKVDYHDKVLSASYLKTTTDIAKDLGMSARKLNSLLNEKGIIYPKKVNGKTKGWYFYSEYDHLVPEYADYHITQFGQSLKWSEKGRKYIIDLLMDEVKDVAFARDNEIDLIDDNDTPDINDIRYN